MKKLIFAFFLSYFFCHQALAEFTGIGKVTSVQLGSVGDIFVITDATKIDPAQCGLQENGATTYVILKTHLAYSEYYIMLLSAMDSGDDVILRIDPTNCVLNGLYPSITLIKRIKP